MVQLLWLLPFAAARDDIVVVLLSMMISLFIPHFQLLQLLVLFLLFTCCSYC
jgi:hypothetical protein